MEGCCSERVNDTRVLSDQAAWSKFQSVERCKQWGVNSQDSFGLVHHLSELDNSPADDGDFSSNTWMNDHDCRVYEEEDDDSEMSGVHGSISESSNYWNAFLNNQDIQVDGFPRTNQTDENFVNSMLLDDVRVGEQYQRNYSNVNKMHDMERSYECFESHQSLSNSIDDDVPQCNETQQNLETNVSVEETVLEDFGKAMHKMTNDTRLCFRDALYRLAIRSGKNSGIQYQKSYECPSEQPPTTSLLDNSRSAEKHTSESRNKAIDITVTDLMFNKEYQQYDDCNPELNPTTKFNCNSNTLLSGVTEDPTLM